MKQNSQWLSQVRTSSNTGESTSTPSGVPASFEHIDRQVEATPAHVDAHLGVVGQHPVLDDVTKGTAAEGRSVRLRGALRPRRPANRG